MTVALGGDATLGARIMVTETVPGGTSSPVLDTHNFDSNNWWKPWYVDYAVDDLAPSIPNNGDFQNAITALDTVSDFVAAGSISVEPNPNITGDEYATLIASASVFHTDLPSATL